MHENKVQMSETDQLKVLVFGDICGNFDAFYKKLKSVNTKAGPFDMVLCAGDFFADTATVPEPKSEDLTIWTEWQSGSKQLPVSTFILNPSSSPNVSVHSDLAVGCELVPNLICLGHHGVMRTHAGLTICYLAGHSDSALPYNHVQSDVDALIEDVAKVGTIDVLLTSDWSKGVWQNCPSQPSSVLDATKDSIGSDFVAQAARSLCPRYHFAGSHNIHWERQPYRNGKSTYASEKLCTRFISLASIGNKTKQKSVYAFNIIPASKYGSRTDLVRATEVSNVTDSPYGMGIAKAETKSDCLSNQFFYDKNAKTVHRSGEKRKSDSSNKRRPIAQPSGPCWFCLSGEQVEKHLIVAIGESVYLALAKGGLTPDHLLITPISHYASWLDIPGEVEAEFDKFKSALVQLFHNDGCDVVFFERNFRTQHIQLQVVPVPEAKGGTVVLDAIRSTAKDCDLDPSRLESYDTGLPLAQLLEPGRPYFRAEGSALRQQVIFRIGGPTHGDDRKRVRSSFPLNFGRMALAHETVLDMASRVDWKSCTKPKAEEEEDCKRFRLRFKPFDFTLDDDVSDEDV